jgi:TolB-like protein/Flp pilus assembly protein TadD
MLVAELKRRNVFKIATAYIVVGWVVLQVAEFLFESFEAPIWVIQSLTVLVVLGFPIAVIFAWAFEATPEGVVLDSEGSLDVPAKWSDYLWGALILATLLAASVNLLSKWTNGAAAIPTKPTLPAATGQVSIAVLPFDNLSSNQENAYFAAGVHEDVLTHLSMIPGLRVISRTSLLQYTDRGTKSVSEIGRELNVNRVLEGSVRRDGGNVRVTVQLIDTEADSHLWSQNYDREMANIFQVQSDIARQVAEQLKLRLDPGTALRISTAPTSNLEAYDLLMRARQTAATGNGTGESLEAALALIELALAEDPDFAAAHAHKAMALVTYTLWIGREWSTVRDRALSAAEEAATLDPLDPAVHVALGRVYAADKRYEDAERELRLALSLNPNSAEAYFNLGEIQSLSSRGAEARESFQRGLNLDPHNSHAKQQLARLYSVNPAQRGLAEKLLEQASELTTDSVGANAYASLLASNRGDLNTAFDHALQAAKLDPANMLIVNFLHLMLINAGHHDLAAQWYWQSRELAPGNRVIYDMAVLAVAAEPANSSEYKLTLSDWPVFLEKWSTAFPDDPVAAAVYGNGAIAAARRSDDQDIAHEALERGRKRLEAALANYRTREGYYTSDGDSERAIITYAILLAELGRQEDMERIARRLVADSENSMDYGAYFNRAQACALLHLRDEALDALEAAFQNGWSADWAIENGAVFNWLKTDLRYIDVMARMKARNRELHAHIAQRQAAPPDPG